MAMHNSDMDRVARRQALVAHKDVLCGLCVFEVDRQDVVDNAEQRVEGGLDRLAAADRRIAVADLLQDLDVCEQHLARRDGALQEPLCVELVGMSSPDEV